MAAVHGTDDIPAALLAWEPEQLRIGLDLRRLGEELGQAIGPQLGQGV